MRVPRRTGRSSMELKMTPMIDVVFLLLVFFLWTSSFDLPEFDLPSSLAEPPAGLSDVDDRQPPPEAFDELVITVGRVGPAGQGLNLTLNGTPVDTDVDDQTLLVDLLRGPVAQQIAGVYPGFARQLFGIGAQG